MMRPDFGSRRRRRGIQAESRPNHQSAVCVWSASASDNCLGLPPRRRDGDDTVPRHVRLVTEALTTLRACVACAVMHKGPCRAVDRLTDLVTCLLMSAPCASAVLGLKYACGDRDEHGD